MTASTFLEKSWHRPRPAIFLAILVAAVTATAAGPALAGNEPEKAQARAEEDVVPKIAFACGVPLAIKYDGESLRQNNQDILHDQTDGDTACNEPLRYLWYACKTDAGKAAVKAAHISKVVCKGVPGSTGTLTRDGATITVGRAFEEKDAFLRSRKQFESLFKVSLKIQTANPYDDEDWHALARQPNPVTSTTTYCLVNGDKVAFDQNVHDRFWRRKEDAKIKCWKDGELVIDLQIDKGKRTGFLTAFHDKGSRRESYRDDKQHGEQRTIADGKLTSLASYENGERAWVKEFRPSGKLASYSCKVAGGSGALAFREDGTVYRLECSPALRNDKELRRWCGFEGASTTPIYDGTGKVSRVVTWKDGVIQKEGAGDSAYAARSDVAFKDGKKQGEERVLRKDGSLESVITWDRGVKDGKELSYSDDGKKVVKEIVWKAGEMKLSTEFYLNGNPKLKENHDVRGKKETQAFWDTGKVSRQGAFVSCETRSFYRSRDWCEEGMHKTYFENGAPQSETMFRRGQRQGTSKTWYDNGGVGSVEEYVDDKRTKAKIWDKDGKLLSDDEFESDGSRKIKR